MPTKLIFSLILLGIFSACEQSPRKSPVTEAEKIETLLEDIVQRHKLVGLAVAATRNDSIIYTGAFGVRNIETKDPMKPGYFFHWASVSKTFVATAILQLVEKGKLNLDEKIITYVPYFKQADGWYKDITLRQMLNHTSGIGDVEDYEWDKPQNDDEAPERFVRSVANDKMLFQPGKDWSYSNTAFEVLGVVITRVSGMPFETYVRENILKPLEMGNSSFIYPDIPDSLRVKGHLWAGKPVVGEVYPYNRIHAPSSTLNSSVLEMTHYAMAHLHRGSYQGLRILADSTYDVMWTNSVNLDEKPKVGVGWFIDEYKGQKTVFHGGADDGFRSYLILVPEKNISVMIASNYEICPRRGIANAVLDILLGAEPSHVRTEIGYPFSEVLINEGIAKAKEFYDRTNSDSTQRSYYFWKEDEGALANAGFALIERKMYTEALDVFKYNLEMNPESGFARGFLGIAYARLGDKEQARKNLNSAIEMKADEEYFSKELKKLDE